jgi:hypothetical protein
MVLNTAVAGGAGLGQPVAGGDPDPISLPPLRFQKIFAARLG